MKNFLGMPAKSISVLMWMKGKQGTMMSYASKNNVRAFVLEITDGEVIVHLMNEKINTGGCFMLGQRAKQQCRGREFKKAYLGQLADVIVTNEELSGPIVSHLAKKPLSTKELAGINKET